MCDTLASAAAWVHSASVQYEGALPDSLTSQSKADAVFAFTDDDFHARQACNCSSCPRRVTVCATTLAARLAM
jgi:hypothetical protein